MSLNLLSLNLDCTVLRKGRLFNFQKTVYILSDETFRYKSLIEMTSWAPTAHTPRHTHSNSWVHNICIRLLVKGQLISKELVGILNSSIKRIKKFNLQYYDTSGRLVFVSFLEELETSKSSFKINWPLPSTRIFRLLMKEKFDAYLLFTVTSREKFDFFIIWEVLETSSFHKRLSKYVLTLKVN